MYHYAGNNPVRYVDPDGKSIGGKLLGYSCYAAAGLVLAGVAASVPIGQLYLMAGAAKLSLALAVAGAAMLAADAVNDGNNQASPSPLFGSNANVAAASPNPLPPDGDDNKDEYESSPKHHQNSKSPEPKNAKEMFDKSVKDPSGRNTRWYKDKDGVIHRFQGNNGKYHWNGSYDGKIKKMPGYIDNAIKNMPKGDL